MQWLIFYKIVMVRVGDKIYSQQEVYHLFNQRNITKIGQKFEELWHVREAAGIQL